MRAGTRGGAIQEVSVVVVFSFEYSCYQGFLVVQDPPTVLCQKRIIKSLDIPESKPSLFFISDTCSNPLIEQLRTTKKVVTAIHEHPVAIEAPPATIPNSRGDCEAPRSINDDGGYDGDDHG